MTSPEASAAIEMTSEEAADRRPSEDGDAAPPPNPLAAGGDSPNPDAGPEPDSGPNSGPDSGPDVGPDSGSESGSDSDSGQSGISNISGLNWKPNAGPICWVQQQIGAGVDPREVLGALRPGIGHIPRHIDDITLWKMIIEIVTEPPRREKLRHVNTLSDVVRLIRGASNVIVLTGAGVSVSCGIPDFRSRDGIYARLAEDFPDLPDPQAMFDIHYFRKDPRPFFKFAREIYPGQFKPSPCHRFIRLLERQRKLLRNYTQNIDTLEQQAGIENVIQCHGSFATASCQRCKYKAPASAIREDIFQQTIPLCPRCTTADAASEAAGAAGAAGAGGEGAAAAAGGAGGSASEGAAAGGGSGDSPATTADGATGSNGSVTGPATASCAIGATSGDGSKSHHSRGATGHPSPKHVAHDVFAAEARDSVTGAAVAAAVAAADAAGMDEALHHGCIEHHLGTHVGAHDGAHDGAHSGTHTGARGGSHSRKHGGAHSGTHGEKHGHHGGKHSRTHGSTKHHGVDDCGDVLTTELPTSAAATSELPTLAAAASELPTAAAEAAEVAARTDTERSSKESPADEDTADSGFAGPAREAEDEAAGRGAHTHDDEGDEEEEKDDKPRAPIMKPDIVFFGEGLPDEFHNSLEHDRDLCDLLIIIGSSLKVRPVALIPSSVGADVAQILINREPLPHLNCDVQLLGDCDVIVHHLCHLLGGPFTELFDDGSGEAGTPKPPLRELTELPPRPADASPPPAADPTSENDTDALRNCWQRKRNESLAARLPEGTFLHQPPCRYVFPGAEVIVDPDDDSDDSDRDSLTSDGAGSPSTRQTSVTPTALDACSSSPSGSAAVGAGVSAAVDSGEPKAMDVGDVDAAADAIRGSKRPLDASDPPPAATADVAAAEGPQPKKTHEDGTDGGTSDACSADGRSSN